MQFFPNNHWISLLLVFSVTILAVLLSFIGNDSIVGYFWEYSISIYFHQSFSYLNGTIVPVSNDSTFNNEKFKINNLTSFRPTSLWCSGILDSLEFNECRFDSICFKPESSEFIFVFDGRLSTFYPPRLRYLVNQTNYGRLSAVWDHNLYFMKYYVTIPFDQLDQLNRTAVYYIPGNTLIMSRFKPDNLMHLIHDDIIPLFATIMEKDLINRLNHIFLDDNWNQTFGSLLFNSLYPNQLLFKGQFDSNSLVCFEKAHIGLSISTIWYQYGFVKPQSPVERSPEEMVYIRNVIELVRNQLVSRMKINQTCTTKHSLLIVRKLNRRILNYQEFYYFLQKRFPNLKLIILDSSLLNENFSQLLETLVCSETLISMHGSEQILSMFLHSSHRTTIIEMFPFGIESGHYLPYRTLATLLGHRYYPWSNMILNNSRFHADDYPPEWGGLSHIADYERSQIESNIEKPLLPHLCCDNLDWLYRIYQDTHIDIAQFSTFLDDLTNTNQLNYNVHHSPSDLFRLSEVQNLRCQSERSNNSYTTMISWQPPWNLVLLGSLNIDLTLSFEVLIQRLHSNEGFLLETRQTRLVLSQSTIDCASSVSGCNVWVRPKPNDMAAQFKLIGFFNRFPILCS